MWKGKNGRRMRGGWGKKQDTGGAVTTSGAQEAKRGGGGRPRRVPVPAWRKIPQGRTDRLMLPGLPATVGKWGLDYERWALLAGAFDGRGRQMVASPPAASLTVRYQLHFRIKSYKQTMAGNLNSKLQVGNGGYLSSVLLLFPIFFFCFFFSFLALLFSCVGAAVEGHWRRLQARWCRLREVPA